MVLGCEAAYPTGVLERLYLAENWNAELAGDGGSRAQDAALIDINECRPMAEPVPCQTSVTEQPLPARPLCSSGAKQLPAGDATSAQVRGQRGGARQDGLDLKRARVKGPEDFQQGELGAVEKSRRLQDADWSREWHAHSRRVESATAVLIHPKTGRNWRS